MLWELIRCLWRGGRITVFTGIRNPRQVQGGELVGPCCLWSVWDIAGWGGEVVRLVYLGLWPKVRAAENEK